MIPKATIHRKHVLEALQEIDKDGVPAQRASKKYSLVHGERQYPPKYVISLAHRIATNHELDSKIFGGGKEANSFLIALGFEIAGVTEKRTVAPKPFPPGKRQRAARHSVPAAHNERCHACKTTIKKLLEKVYVKVLTNYRLDLATKPDNLTSAHYGRVLKTIYQSLQNYRGHREFVRSMKLAHCDWFVPQPGFVIEFDESQHFTKCRELALEEYPRELSLGYDRQLWIRRCRRICAKDNNPPYRDEQRA